MTRHDDSEITRTLRQMDAADPEIDQTQRPRAVATLEQILATDPDVPAPNTVPVPARRRRLPRLLVASGVAAAAAVVAVPLVTGGSEAFATWSRTPVELTGPERAAAVDACMKLQADGRGELAFDPAAAASVLVAEARGGWSYVVFTVPARSGSRLQGSCLLPDDLVAEPRPGEGGFFGSLHGADETAGPAPRREAIREDESGVGSVDDEFFAYVEGRVGSDVTGIEVLTPNGLRVEASIDNGRWAAWWPGDEDYPKLSAAPTFRVTLRDGTVTDQTG